jgi:hypothetical protein
MNTERIKQLAEQAGYTKDMFGIGHWDMPECKKFAELIAAEEREACAKMCEELECDALYDRKEIHPIDCAIAIRSRGNDAVDS